MEVWWGDEVKWAGMGCQISKEGNVIKEEGVGERREEKYQV